MKKGSLQTLNWTERLTFIKDIPFTEKDFQSLGTKFQVIRFAPHTDIKPHYHKKRIELFYAVEGSGLIIINREEFRVQPNDFFLCEIGDVHQFVNDTNQDFTILVFRTNEPEDEDFFWA